MALLAEFRLNFLSNKRSPFEQILPDRPKSVRNCCVIDVFGGVFVVTLLFGFFCRCRGFCHRTKSDLFLFLLLVEIK